MPQCKHSGARETLTNMSLWLFWRWSLQAGVLMFLAAKIRSWGFWSVTAFFEVWACLRHVFYDPYSRKTSMVVIRKESVTGEAISPTAFSDEHNQYHRIFLRSRLRCLRKVINGGADCLTVHCFKHISFQTSFMMFLKKHTENLKGCIPFTYI